ncbi:MAG: diacylglycerol kinase family lipid kinase [Anaerolineae bacterium]|nr:diacylglycerol kinase family lipid kinase [Phycisphaerae bacterium]
MRICVITNPRAGSAERWEMLRARIKSLGDIHIVETSKPGDASDVAAQAVADRLDMIVAAGGDGTVNEVVNGMMSDSEPGNVKTVLAILPLGTGNDLARTLNVPLDPAEAISTIASRLTIKLDLMKVKWADHERFATNAAAGGFTGQVNEAMTDEIKSRWGPLAYLRGAIGILPDLTKYQTSVRYDGKAKQPVHALNIIVANGRSAGGGILIAPQADPSDGLLDVVIVRSGTTLELAAVAARLLGGDYTNSDVVTHERVKRVEVESTPGMWFNIDGELITNEPISFTIVPSALEVIVGRVT